MTVTEVRPVSAEKMEGSVRVPARMLAGIVRAVASVASKDGIRPVLATVRFGWDAESVSFVATDSYRLVRVALDLESLNGGDGAIVGSGAVLFDAVGLSKFAAGFTGRTFDACAVSVSADGLVVPTVGTYAASGIPAGDYPNLTGIPVDGTDPCWAQSWDDGPVSFTVNPDFLASTVKAVFAAAVACGAGKEVATVRVQAISALKPVRLSCGPHTEALLMPVRTS